MIVSSRRLNRRSSLSDPQRSSYGSPTHTAKIIHADEKGSVLITRKLNIGCYQTLMAKATGPALKTLSKDELERYLDGDEIEVKRTGYLQG